MFSTYIYNQILHVIPFISRKMLIKEMCLQYSNIWNNKPNLNLQTELGKTVESRTKMYETWLIYEIWF